MSSQHPSFTRNPTAAQVMERLRRLADGVRSVVMSAAEIIRQIRSHRVAVRVLNLSRVMLRWIPLTSLGWVSILGLAWLLRDFGIARRDQVLLALTSTGLAVISLLMLATLAAAVWLKFRNADAVLVTVNGESGVESRTGFVIPVLGYVPIVDLSIEWGRPTNAEFGNWRPVDVSVRLEPKQGQLAEAVTPARRGRLQEIVRRIRIGDVFGLTRIVFDRPGPADVTIRPRGSEAGRPSPWTQFRAGDAMPDADAPPEGDLIELRDYQPGDPLKRVCWKKYKRTGRLIVRSPERALEPCEQIAVTTVSAMADEPSAVLARSLLETGAVSGRMIFCADGETAPTSDPLEGEAQLIRSAAAMGVPGSGFDRLREHPDVASCVVFVPHRPGPWLDAVAARIEQTEHTCRVIVGVNEEPSVDSPRWKRWIVSEPDGNGSQTADLQSIAGRLRASGADVSVVDCVSGREMPLPESN